LRCKPPRYSKGCGNYKAFCSSRNGDFELLSEVSSFFRYFGDTAKNDCRCNFLSEPKPCHSSINQYHIWACNWFCCFKPDWKCYCSIYLAITRPFRIGDRIKVFNGDGRVSDIWLLYTRLLLDNGDEMLVSNSSMVTTNIILRKKQKGEENQEQ
jgi:hypothetical protein